MSVTITYLYEDNFNKKFTTNVYLLNYLTIDDKFDLIESIEKQKGFLSWAMSDIDYINKIKNDYDIKNAIEKFIEK